VQVRDQETGGRDEDILFDRGSSVLDAGDRTKIGRLLARAVNPLKGCTITLEGFVSEDELVEFGSSLATDRINAVDAEFAAQHHDDPGPACPTPAPPLRTHSPLPAVSSGVSAYRRRRKVEVVPAGATSTTAPCPPGSAQHRALTATESTTLTNAVDQAVVWDERRHRRTDAGRSRRGCRAHRLLRGYRPAQHHQGQFYNLARSSRYRRPREQPAWYPV
jgi:hypothetical protein